MKNDTNKTNETGKDKDKTEKDREIYLEKDRYKKLDKNGLT
jgi:hypothetical protein